MNDRVFFDSNQNRLVFLMEQATPDFWDRHWNTEDLQKKIMKGSSNGLIKYWTQKYLVKGARVLEGGCGDGSKVYGLKQWGYDACGVDFAGATIEKIQHVFPELNVSQQDVRNLSFPDASFDGYWSIGVIEHFYDGYGEILREAERVLKLGGILFLTFPVMCPIRRIKAKLGFYSEWPKDHPKELFYQFALSDQCVRNDFAKYGFRLCAKQYFDGVKGLKDEVPLLKPLLQRVYNSPSISLRFVRKCLDGILNPWTTHSVLLVYKKE